ncbi:IS200/IS605 family transposase [Chroococcidiopsis sp. CCNUC1]|uniref:IS200/IS605 family transposase n=1 Tax=Chroococcidiopsis sp. CCNUC1 TaxID=2653189 RepID=UPI00353236BF
MALWRLYYHLVWATKERQSFIAPDIEPKLYSYLIGKADSLGSIIHAIGGIENHIHLVASIPPSLSIANFVKNLKGSSAHHLNHSLPNSSHTFAWQRGYGVFSLGGKQLTQAVDYVSNQKAHHLQRTTIASLERDSYEEDAPLPWNQGRTVD